jgi:hypothetical protein
MVITINAFQAELEERVTDKLDKRLKGMTSMEEQQTCNTSEDLIRNIEARVEDVVATPRDLEATRQDFETQLAAVGA